MTRLTQLALSVALLGSATVHADIFSPGELARPHANLEGLSNCTQCHPAGDKLSQETCLACHFELRPHSEGGKGFHGKIPRDQRNCEACHLEHQGRELKLTVWPAGGMKAFEHNKTGWPLLGKHSQVTCLTCHEKRLIVEQPILKFLAEHPQRENPTMLGLSERCDSCHFDEHRAQTVKECQSCHNEKAWSPAPGFNHQKTAYPLEGKHKKVACDRCHPSMKDDSTASEVFPKPVSMSFLKYKPITHKECLSCHEDPHKGSFGERCQSCHTVDGWLIIRNQLKEREFHDKTRYPLRGEHVGVTCVACHGPFPGVPAQFKNMKFDSCNDCHVDAHEGQIQSRVAPMSQAGGPRCETCHAVDGFKPVLFDLKDHDKTRYPLEGDHRVVACNECHVPEAKLETRIPVPVRLFLKKRHRLALFSIASMALPKVNQQKGACELCHDDVHAGQFKKEQACVSCHAVAGWTQLTFDHDKDTSFPLTGKHSSATCVSCHPTVSIRGAKTVKYVGAEKTCDGCHADVHVAQFASGRPARTDCATCHDTTDWKKTSFVHAPPFTQYLLEGAHQKVSCEACHPTVKVAAGMTAVRYKPLPTKCEGCHSDFHKGAFKGFIP